MSAAADQNPAESTPAQPARPEVPGDAASPSASSPARSALAGSALFRERLVPGVGAWIVVVVLGATFGVVLLPLSTWAALVVGVVAVAVACVLAFVTSPVLEVSGGTFSMGRAHIDVDLLGAPEVLTGEDWERTMHTGFEPLAHHCTRGWIHSGIRIEVLDRDDPVTAWVASSRRPEDLALALRSAQQHPTP